MLARRLSRPQVNSRTSARNKFTSATKSAWVMGGRSAVPCVHHKRWNCCGPELLQPLQTLLKLLFESDHRILGSFGSVPSFLNVDLLGTALFGPSQTLFQRPQLHGVGQAEFSNASLDSSQLQWKRLVLVRDGDELCRC